MSDETKMLLPHRVNQLIAAVLGTLITWALNNMIGLDAVLASASVAICGGLFTKKYHGIWMAGTFAGMCGIGAMPGPSWACLVGVIVFLIWVAIEKMMAGVGGKYGFIACWSGFLAQLIIIPVRMALGFVDATKWNTFFVNVGAWEAWFITQPINWLMAPLLCMIGAVATIWVRNKLITPKFGVENTTIASAFVGLMGYFVIWGILATIGDTSYAGKWGAMIYMGSFAGMASTKRIRLSGKSDLIAFAIVGLITGCLFYVSRLILPYGGLYGWTAAVSVMIYDLVFAKYLFKEEPHDLRTFIVIQK